MILSLNNSGANAMYNLFENNDSLFDIMQLSDGGLLIKIRYKDFNGQFVYYIEDDNIVEYIKSLKELNDGDLGELLITDMDSDSYIKLEKIKYGHIIISGQLGSAFQENYLVFKFPADQTVVSNLIDRLTVK